MFGFVVNILLLNMNKIKIYLAGKIKSNGWRQAIFNMRNEFLDYEFYNHQTLKNVCVNLSDDVIITGPFFLSCDHSCYHGNESHGLGVNQMTCGQNEFSEEEVIDICKTQIERANIIFAYIDDNTCYGTLFELGLAHAMHKRIVVVFDTKKRQHEMWFIAKNSDFFTNLENHKTQTEIESLIKFDNYEKEILSDFIYNINEWKKRNDINVNAC